MKRHFILIACCISSMAVAQHGHDAAGSDKASTHGMLIFGTEKIYASHLPLFHPPHDYQVILELELMGTDKKTFIADQQRHPECATYSIEPEKFVLPDMLANPFPFKANVYRGHFERGGDVLLEQVTVKIKQVVYFKKFDVAETRAATTRFIVFGNQKELFAVHHITNKPDFEQIIQLSAMPETADKFQLITFNERENSPVGVSGNTITTADGKSITLLRQLYLEFEDLK